MLISQKKLLSQVISDFTGNNIFCMEKCKNTRYHTEHLSNEAKALLDRRK